MITIAPAKPEDVEDIQDVYYKTWLATYPNEKYGITREDIEEHFKDSFTEEVFEKRRARILNMPENEKYVVAKDSEKIIGVCRAVKHPDKNILRAIYVLPKYQGKGTGFALWQEIKNIFDLTKETVAHVAIYNKKAISFYEGLGFKDTGKRFTEERFRMKSGNIMPEMEMILKSEK